MLQPARDLAAGSGGTRFPARLPDCVLLLRLVCVCPLGLALPVLAPSLPLFLSPDQKCNPHLLTHFSNGTVPEGYETHWWDAPSIVGLIVFILCTLFIRCGGCFIQGEGPCGGGGRAAGAGPCGRASPSGSCVMVTGVGLALCSFPVPSAAIAQLCQSAVGQHRAGTGTFLRFVPSSVAGRSPSPQPRAALTHTPLERPAWIPDSRATYFYLFAF